MRAATLFYLLSVSVLLGQSTPEGYLVPPNTISPDQRFGVLVPLLAAQDTLKNPQNSVIDLKTGKLLGPIQEEYVAYDHINNGEIVPTLWATDDSMLLWRVDSKWGADAVTLAALGDTGIKWQLNIYGKLQQEILKRTQAAAPSKYAAVKVESAGDGSWFKDGFAVDCVLTNDGSLSFPLEFRVFLTSDTKSVSQPVRVDSRMTATVLKDGTIRIEKFYLGSEPPARWWIRPEQLEYNQ